MGNKKKIRWNFSKLEYKQMAEYLEEMAGKGWMAQEITRNKAVFVRSEPKNLKFCVDVVSRAESFAHTGGSENPAEYRNTWEVGGWKFLSSYGQLRFFCADRKSSAAPLRTEIELIKNIKDNVWKKELFTDIFSFILILAACAFLFFFIYRFKYELFLEWDTFAILTIAPLGLVFSIFETYKTIKWYADARAYINDGTSIDYIPLNNVKIKNFIITISQRIMLLFAFMSYVKILFPGDLTNNWLARLMIYAVILYAVAVCAAYMKFKDYLTGKKEAAFVIFAFVGLTALLYIMALLNIFEEEKSPKNLYSISDKYSVIRISDFADIEEINDNSFTKKISPFVPLSYTYREYYSDDSNNKYVSYRTNCEYYKCFNDKIANIIYEGIFDDYKNKTYLYDYIYDSSTEYWNCDKAFAAENSIVLLKGNEVIAVDVSKDLMNIYDDKFKEILFEKFY